MLPATFDCPNQSLSTTVIVMTTTAIFTATIGSSTPLHSTNTNAINTSTYTSTTTKNMLATTGNTRLLSIVAAEAIESKPQPEILEPPSTPEQPLSTESIYLKIIIGIFLVLVIMVSIFGNILVCVAIASDRRLRRLGNLFLVSLAIADLCVGALVMTFALANDLLDYWPFWPQLCEIWIAFDISCSTCSIINLCAIALDRFAHIKDPMLYNRWMNKRIVIISVTIIWLVSCLISFVPISLGWHRPQITPIVLNQNHRYSPISDITTSPLSLTAATPNTEQFWSTTAKFNRLKRSVHHYPYHASLPPDYLQDESEFIDQYSFKPRLYSPMFFNDSKMAIKASPAYYLPVPVFSEQQEQNIADDDDDDEKQLLLSLNSETVTSTTTTSTTIQPPVSNNLLRHSKHFSHTIIMIMNQYQRYQQQHLPQQEVPNIKLIDNIKQVSEFNDNLNQQENPQCALDLTPTYAVVSSCISFYFPCLIMLCLYARLYSICQQHVKSIKSMTMITPPTTSTPVLGNKKSPRNENGKNKDALPMVPIVKSQVHQPALQSHHLQHQQQQSHVSEHKAAITLGIIMGTFLACWMPFFFMNIVAAFCKTCIPSLVFKILTWLGYFNSCLNPAIYSIFNTEFRDAFRRILMRYLFQTQMSQSCNRTLCCDQCRSGQNGNSGQCCGCFGRPRNQQSQQNSSSFVTDYAGTRNINNGKNRMTNMTSEEENSGTRNLKMIRIDEQPPEITAASTETDKILFNEANNGQDKMEILPKYNNKIISTNNENIIKNCCNNKKTSINNENPPVGHNLQSEYNSNLFLEQHSSSYSTCSKCFTNSMGQTEQPEMEQNLPNENLTGPLSSSSLSELQMECNSNQPKSISSPAEQFQTIPEFQLLSQANTQDLVTELSGNSSQNNDSAENKCRQNKPTTTANSPILTSTTTLNTKTNPSIV